MRGTILHLITCGALLVSVVPAQALAKDPVQELKDVLASGHGLLFTETAMVLNGVNKLSEHRRKGSFEFSAKGGVNSLDVTTTGGEGGRERVIGFNHENGTGTSYRSGGLVSKRLPAKKSWLKQFHLGFLGHTRILGDDEQLINPTEPATLAALLKNGRRNGKTVTGTVSFKELGKVSRWMKHSDRAGWEDKTQILYILTLNSSGLVNRVESRFTVDASGPDGLAGKVIHVETLYSRWGSKVSIKAPDPRKTTTKLCNENSCR